MPKSEQKLHIYIGMEESASKLFFGFVFLFPLLFFLICFGLFLNIYFFCWGRRLIVADFKVKGYVFKEKDIRLPYLHVEILSLQAYRSLTSFGMYFHMCSMSDQKYRLSGVLIVILCILHEICSKLWKNAPVLPQQFSLCSHILDVAVEGKNKTKTKKNTQKNSNIKSTI